jgi:HAD superfamily hydrolase (TIGR01509 family)
VIKGVIFDMDGVLIDSEVVFRKHLYDFFINKKSEVEISELNFLAGSCDKVESEYIAKKLNTSIKEANEMKKAYFKEITVDYIKLKKPYVNELLEYLVLKNIKIGLASSSKMENINRVLEECKIKKYFTSVVSGEMFAETKPNPEIYNYSVRAINLNKEDLLVVEDSNYGVQAGKAAGLKVAAILDSIFRFDVEAADYKLKSLKDVIEIIESQKR